MSRPEVRYAPTPDGYVAYQIVGDGPVDIVLQTGWTTHVDIQWDVPDVARFLERLASFSRLIVFDRLGYGMSDPIDIDNLTLERWMKDTAGVMDAAGSDRAVIVGTVESGPTQILFAATHPERTAGLVLINTWACARREDDYPWGFPEATARRAAARMLEFVLGANNETLAGAAPDLANSEYFRDAYRRLIRAATSPTLAERVMMLCLSMDARDVLPSVRCPTLIVHNARQPFCRVEHGRYLAKHIDGARYVELPGSALYPWWGDEDAVLSEIEEFVTGERSTAGSDRVLSTVMLTDIVGSTERASSLGDRRWRQVLDSHDAEVARQLARFDGRKVSSIGRGDGILATFDGPARAVRCARSIVDALGSLDVDVRAGVHTGEIERRGDDISGIAVHIADRVASLAGPREVVVSRTVVDLVVGSGLSFVDRGAHALKGVEGEWQLYAVER